jgi:hypothetical protein
VIENERGDKSPHSKELDCDDLRVIFDWSGDRFGHRVERRVAGEWRLVLETVEGSADEVWPPSPALQSLHIEHREAGPVALLVGKSGTSHWSASVELLDSRTGFQIDIACRVQTAPGRLGSVYQVAGSPDWSLVKVAAPQQQAICNLIEQHRSKSWHVRPFIDSSCGFPCTIRWRYTISVVNDTA